MESKTTGTYRAQDFARLAGVTVRALHHYDRLGLLTPSRRPGSGYRVYRDRDLARLEQIVVLKFLGLPLKEIRDLLTEEVALGETLRRQRRVLAERRTRLERAIRAIEKAERGLDSAGEPDWELLKRIIEEVHMQDETEWTKKYYTEGAQAKVEERKALWSPELQERVSRQWAELYADIREAIGENPAGPTGQVLAARWKELVSGFTGGDLEIQKGLNSMYADQDNWPDDVRQKWQTPPEILAFITEAMKATQ